MVSEKRSLEGSFGFVQKEWACSPQGVTDVDGTSVTLERPHSPSAALAVPLTGRGDGSGF